MSGQILRSALERHLSAAGLAGLAAALQAYVAPLGEAEPISEWNDFFTRVELERREVGPSFHEEYTPSVQSGLGAIATSLLGTAFIGHSGGGEITGAFGYGANLNVVKARTSR